ncbi:MAG TPA: hypothetical protein VH912_19650 [Streptosporangiaceae bacterium]
MSDAILDPTGRRSPKQETAGPRLAPRRADLRGATIGLLENTKHNAALTQAEVRERAERALPEVVALLTEGAS